MLTTRSTGSCGGNGLATPVRISGCAGAIATTPTVRLRKSYSGKRCLLEQPVAISTAIAADKPRCFAEPLAAPVRQLLGIEIDIASSGVAAAPPRDDVRRFR